MARIFITGSSDGLGLKAAQHLVKQGHRVVLHARNAQRAKDATSACPGAETVAIGDLSSMAETKTLAAEINKLGSFDAVIHNAGLYQGGFRRTPEGLPSLVAVNTFAPYILTCLIAPRPKHLTFLSSGLHSGGDGSCDDITWSARGEKGWRDGQAYGDSKLHNIMLANAFARRWPDVCSNSMDPGWVATKMGGQSAPGDINKTVETYTMLALGEGAGSGSGKYFKPGRMEASPMKVAEDKAAQDKLMKICEEVTGVKVPEE